MNQGKIIEYIDQGKLVSSLCLQDKGNKLHLLTLSNREINLSPKRALLVSSTAINANRPREELLDELKKSELLRNDLKEQIDVLELWELIKEEEEIFDHKYYAQLVFGETVTEAHLSALVRALFEDHLHFKLKEGHFIPNSEERVDLIKKKKEEEEARKQQLKEESEWLKRVLKGEKIGDYSTKKELINMLIKVALNENEKIPSDYKYLKELLHVSGISDAQTVMSLLVKLGVWEEDENFDLLRYAIQTTFTSQQMEESLSLLGKKLDFTSREDLRSLPVMTIDGPQTIDYDDAFSFKWDGDELELEVHIADVSEFILPGTILDQEAAGRSASHYFPRRQIPMFPEELIENTLSLKKDSDRMTISLLTRINTEGKILNYRFVPGIIRVQRQLTYEDINQELTRNNDLAKLYKLVQRFYQKRIRQGALDLSLPDLEIKFNADSSLTIEQVAQNSPSRLIVAEIMILYNNLAARFCRDNQIPVLYRTQTPSTEIITQDELEYVYYVFKQRRKLAPLHLNKRPKPHSGLGLDAYIQVTSPIRRYLDLVVQRQIKSFIMGNDLIYNHKDLEAIRISVMPILKELQMIKRNRMRYWMLKYLSQNMDMQYKAMILDELKTKYRIVLCDIFLLAEIKKQEGVLLNHGEQIMIQIKTVHPRKDILELKYSGLKQ